MTKKLFVRSWKRSVQPRRQRKYLHHAPLHVRQKLVHAHLSPELRKKYHRRALQVRVGDKVKVIYGQFKKKEGKVERIDLRGGKVTVTGVEYLKRDGSKKNVPMEASNLMIMDLNLDDKRRMEKLAETTVSAPTPKINAPPKAKREKK